MPVAAAPSTVSGARTRLRELGLIGRDTTPLDTGLFWAAAESWAAFPWAGLTTIPDLAPHLLDVGTAAAIAAATPIVATGDPAPRLLTTDRRTHSRMRSLHPTDSKDAAASTMLLAPDVWALPDPDRRRTGAGHNLAHPVLIALDLGADPARGAEALAGWTPQDIVRVW